MVSRDERQDLTKPVGKGSSIMRKSDRPGFHWSEKIEDVE